MTGEELLSRLNERADRSNPAVEDLVASFGEGLMMQKELSPGFFAFLTELLSNPKFFNIEGVEGFLLEALTSLDIMSEGQKAELLKVLVDNYQEYNKENLCFCVGDFIARAYDSATALAVIERLAARVSLREQKLGLLLATDIIGRRNREGEPELLNRLERLFNSIQL